MSKSLPLPISDAQAQGRSRRPVAVLTRPAPAPCLLKLEMVADRLAISPRSVRRLIDQKELPVHHIGSSRRVSEDDLARYLAGTRRS